jgi:hypothetical protein
VCRISAAQSHWQPRNRFHSLVSSTCIY